MRVLLTIFLCVLGWTANSQTKPSGFPAQKTTTWHDFGYLQGDSAVIMAKRDTLNFLPRFSGTVVMRPQDRRLYMYDSALLKWYKLSFDGDIPSGTFFAQDGNSFADTARLGTNDNFPLLFETNNTRRGIINTSGQFGLGTLTPAALLDVNGKSFFRDTLNSEGILRVGKVGMNGEVQWRRSGDGSVVGRTSVNGGEFIHDGSFGFLQLQSQGTAKMYLTTTGIRIGSNATTSFASQLESAYLTLLPGDSATNRGGPLKFTLDGARVLNVKQRGVMEAHSNYLMWTDSLLNRDTLASRRWVRNNFTGGGGSIEAFNALTKSNDTIYWGGDLTKWTWVKTYSNRTETPVAPNENAIVIGNEIVPDSSNYWWLSANDATTNIYDKSNIYLSRTYGHYDTVYKNYGGNISATTFTKYDSAQPRYKNIATPIILPYGNMSANHVLHPPDTAYVQTSPYGHTANFGADFRIGANRPYNVTIFSQSNISGPYPMTVYRGGIDLAHRSSAVKRESYGNGYVSYVSDFRNHQATVTAGSTELGSYVSKIGGFYANGALATFSTSPSKAKTLAVSTADTVFAFWAAPQYTSLNETKNGYGYIAQGTEDDNHFAGRFRLGGSLPLHATVMRRFHNTGTSEMTDTVYMSKLLKLGFGTATPASGTGFNIYMDTGFQVGYSYGNRVYASIAQYQTGITSANYATKRTKGLIVEMDLEYSDAAVDITDKFQRAVLGYQNIIADSFISVSSTNGGLGGSEFGLLYRKRTGYTDTTVFKGGATPSLSPWALSGTLDMTGTQATGVTRLNWAKGYHTALNAKVSWGAWHRVDNAIWLRTGDVQSGGSNSQVDTGYQIYMLPSDVRVLTKYAIYQAGTLDTNYLAGPLRLPFLPIGGSSDSVLVKTANGTVKTVAQSSIGGGGSGTVTNFIFTDGSGFDGTVSTATTTPTLSLTTTLTTTHIPVIGAFGALTGSSAFLNDGTSVKQENALASYSGTSTTAGGSTSGFDFRGFIKATPSAANQRLAAYMAGTLDGGTTENITAGLQFYSNGAFTPGSSEQTYATMSTSATSVMNEVQRWTANGRSSFGNIANPSALLHLNSGSASLHPFMLTSGTDVTSPLAGGFEFGTLSSVARLTFTPTNGNRRRVVLMNDVTPSAGGILQGNAAEFTLLALGTAGQILSVNAGATALQYGFPNYTLMYSDTTTTTVANTTTESTLLGNGVGSLSFPGSMLVAGSVISWKGTGTISTAAVAGIPTFNFNIGSVTVGIGSGLSGLAALISGAAYEYEFEVFQFQAGTNKDCFYRVKVDVYNAGVLLRSATSGLLPTSFSSTGTITCNVTGDWNTADPANSIVSHSNILEVKLRQ